MKIKLHNNDDSDSIIYSGTLESIREQAKERIKLANWKNGWSEITK